MTERKVEVDAFMLSNDSHLNDIIKNNREVHFNKLNIRECSDAKCLNSKLTVCHFHQSAIESFPTFTRARIFLLLKAQYQSYELHLSRNLHGERNKVESVAFEREEQSLVQRRFMPINAQADAGSSQSACNSVLAQVDLKNVTWWEGEENFSVKTLSTVESIALETKLKSNL